MSDWLVAHRPLVIAHRGASAEAPENSLSAFALALEQGADGIELDVQLSADGWPIVMHDARVDRTTNGQGYVANLTLAQLRTLDGGDGRSVPTLDEVFEAFGPALLYNVELKDRGWRDHGLLASVADRIEGHHLEDRVLVSSFNPMTIRRARRHLAKRIPVAVIRMPGLQQYAYWLASGEADHPHHTLVDERYMAWATNRGYRVHVWTVDDPARAQRLASLGVNAIITNNPVLILAALEDMA